VPLYLRGESHKLTVVRGETVGRRSLDVGHGDPYLSGCDYIGRQLVRRPTMFIVPEGSDINGVRGFVRAQ
jgi:hypothetical protein